MATEVECIVAVCPKCGEEFGTWQGVGLEKLGPDPCPHCGFIPEEDPRLHRDGLVVFDEDDAREPS